MTRDETTTVTSDGNAAKWFAELFKDLVAAFPSYKANERQTRVYAAALQDFTPDDVRQAFRLAIIEGRFFPSVHELRSYVQLSTGDRAVLSWTFLRERAVPEWGAYQSVVFDDPCIAIAVQQSAGAWHKFCELEEGPALGAVRQAYLIAYRDARRRTVSAQPIRLPGLCELESRANGHTLPTSGWLGRVTLALDVIHVREHDVAGLLAGTTLLQLNAGGENGQPAQ